MKKLIYLFIFLFCFCILKAFATCEYIAIDPSGVSPGDTVVIEIYSEFVNCVEYNRAGYIEPLGFDTLYFDEFEIISDTLAKVLAVFPANLPYAETEFFICNTNYWDNRVGCNLTIGSNITVYDPDLCMVTVGEEGKNMIIWAAPILEDIDSVLIYKESFMLNNFIQAGSVQRGRFHFIDTLSEPAQKSDRYKIMMKDRSGNETLMSDAHKTIHLTINAGMNGAWNLIWNKYEGFQYKSYRILRGTSEGNLSKIAEVPVNTFSYTDFFPPVETSFYQIEAINPNPCILEELKSSLTVFNSTRSNMVVSEGPDFIHAEMNWQIQFWPNPVTDKLNYSIGDQGDSTELSILSMDGKILIKKQLIERKGAINLSELNSGFYLLRLSSGDLFIYRKFLKR